MCSPLERAGFAGGGFFEKMGFFSVLYQKGGGVFFFWIFVLGILLRLVLLILLILLGLVLLFLVLIAFHNGFRLLILKFRS